MVTEQLQEILRQLSDTRDSYIRELSALPEGKLLCSKGADCNRYYVSYKQDGLSRRRGITKDKERIALLARKEFVLRALQAIEKNIKVMQKASDQYRRCDPKGIIQTLSATYKSLPEDAFFESLRAGSIVPHEADTALMRLDATDRQRIALHEAWGAEPYEPPDYMPEGRVLLTSRGERMRSKAEVMVAEKLYEYGIPFRYEQSLQVGGRLFHPDFTFEGHGGELFFLEFCGMMDDPSYAVAFRRKRAAYEEAGIVEWRNMIYVFASGNEMNMMLIDSVIRTRIIPWL